jgi:tetratricopeptide (TPR) repeat protein
MRRVTLSALLVGLAIASTAPQGHAAKPKGSASAAASAAATVDVPLPPLPALQPLAKLTASKAALDDVDLRIDQLLSLEVDGPLADVDLGFLTSDLDDAKVAAIRRRLVDLKENIAGSRARRQLDDARSRGRKAIKKAQRRRKKEGGSKIDEEGNWLVFFLALDRPEKSAWRDAVRLYGMMRMLEAVGSTPAVRVMVDSYSWFGELVRIDLQRALDRLEHAAVPALMEAKEHDAKKVRRWARRQLDRMGKAIPGEAVSTTDTRVLADVLRAFGRIRDIEATRVILSYANSDQVELRQAAREAIGAIGKPARWHLKDSYENLTGNKAPRAWDWKRTARELFRLHDRARLAAVYQQMDVGKKAAADKRWEAAVEAYDQVLAHSPLFEQRAEMVPAYRAHAESLLASGKREPAMVALRKALRLAPESPERKPIESLLTTVEAELLIDQGTPDPFLLERAVELDPTNTRAKELLASLEHKAEARQQRGRNYLGAAGVGFAALLLLLFIGFGPRGSAPKSRTKTEDQRPASEPAAEPESEPESEPEPEPESEPEPD